MRSHPRSALRQVARATGLLAAMALVGCGSGGADPIATLWSLSVSAGTLTPGFDPDVHAYTVEVDYLVTEVSVTPKVTGPASALTVNGVANGNGVPSAPIPLPLGTTPVTVRVADFDGVPSTDYVVAFTRALPTEAQVLAIAAAAYAWSSEAGPYGGLGNWFHGSVRGGEANKGANLASQPEANELQRYAASTTNAAVLAKWQGCYEGIRRVHQLMELIDLCPDPALTAAERTELKAQARFLRALWYFDLRRCFGNVPWIDETMDAATALQVPNNVEIYPQIEADLAFAIANLPATQPVAGRPNLWSAKGYLGKVQLTQARYADALATLNDVATNGKSPSGAALALLPSYGSVFSAAQPDHAEVLFGTQGSANAPVPAGSSGPVGCCGFFQPSFEQARAFITDANGLPLLGGTFRTAAYATDFGIPSASPFTPHVGGLDPRTDHTIGRRSIPFLDWGDHVGMDWIQDQAFGGPFAPRKYVLPQTSGQARGATNENQALLRLADVHLMLAECHTYGGSLEAARAYVNQVRARSANPAAWVKRGDGSNAANYVIGLYNTPWVDAATSRQAIQFERRLELAGEGHRFFDLVRWGLAGSELNAYLALDGASLTAALGGASFTPGVDELYPIPQAEIDARAPGVLTQNPGY